MLNNILKILFWTSTFLLLYHYVFFPIILKIISKFKNIEIKLKPNYQANISVLIAVHNEEKVIKQKILSILEGNYPLSKIEIFIGSDSSTDSTNSILKQLSAKYKNIHVKYFEERIGKPEIINKLIKFSNNKLIIITDANVFLEKNTISELVKYFSVEKIGLVDTKMENYSLKTTGISVQESKYNQLENFIKRKESEIFGYMMGPFGGCFAIRKKLFIPVPKNFLVDDFFINMSILQQNYYSIQASSAIVKEDVSNNIIQEFRRKKRIGTGNFQNLKYFQSLLFSPKFGLSFLFWSHKIIRWFSFVLLIIIFMLTILLSRETYYKIFLYLYLFSIFVSLLDIALKRFNKDILILRFITHFYAMNLALFIGFINFLKGVKSNVWQPTKRNQS